MRIAIQASGALQGARARRGEADPFILVLVSLLSLSRLVDRLPLTEMCCTVTVTCMIPHNDEDLFGIRVYISRRKVVACCPKHDVIL